MSRVRRANEAQRVHKVSRGLPGLLEKTEQPGHEGLKARQGIKGRKVPQGQPGLLEHLARAGLRV